MCTADTDHPPLVRARALETYFGTPAEIYYKRGDLNPTGSHKFNTALVQAYYATREEDSRIRSLVTDTGAGQGGAAHAVLGAIDAARDASRTGRKQVIVFCLSGHGYLDLKGRTVLRVRACGIGNSLTFSGARDDGGPGTPAEPARLHAGSPDPSGGFAGAAAG